MKLFMYFSLILTSNVELLVGGSMPLFQTCLEIIEFYMEWLFDLANYPAIHVLAEVSSISGLNTIRCSNFYLKTLAINFSHSFYIFKRNDIYVIKIVSLILIHID